MKKLFLIVTFALLFTLSGCQYGLRDAFIKMSEVESYQMDMTMEHVPYLGTFTVTLKVDGDLQTTSSTLNDKVSYAKEIDGEIYAYNQVIYGKYVLSDTPLKSEDLLDHPLNGLDYNDFKQIERGVWKLTKDRIYLNKDKTDYMHNIVITLNADGYIEKLAYIMVSNDLSIKVVCEFSEYNNTTVTAPDLY